MNRRVMLSFVVLAASLVAAACGSNSPSSPGGSGSVSVQGVVLGSGAAATGVSASAHAQSAAGPGKLVVSVAGTTITAEVSANGTFEFEGVPEGTFTLIFSKNGVEIGRVQITAQAGAEVKITVQVTETATIVVVKLEVDDDDTEEEKTSTCVIEGGKAGKGIELEGKVASGTAAAFKLTVHGERSTVDVDVAAAAASFKCNGGKKLTDAECKASVKAGAQVHVRGTLMTCTTSAASVTASEVKVQKAESGDDEDDD